MGLVGFLGAFRGKQIPKPWQFATGPEIPEPIRSETLGADKKGLTAEEAARQEEKTADRQSGNQWEQWER